MSSVTLHPHTLRHKWKMIGSEGETPQPSINSTPQKKVRQQWLPDLFDGENEDLDYAAVVG
jgi:hypothetical protein